MFQKLTNFLESPETILCFVIFFAIVAYHFFNDLLGTISKQADTIARLEVRLEVLEEDHFERERKARNDDEYNY